MLVMDDVSMHKIDIVKDKLEECKTKVSMISGGLTRYLQDVFINKRFKDELKGRYTKYCIHKKDTKARVTQEDLINWIGEIWYDNKLSSEIVSKSFKTVESLWYLMKVKMKNSSVIIYSRRWPSHSWTSRTASRWARWRYERCRNWW